MAKRTRTCPTTGIPLKGVDESYLRVDGREIDIERLHAQFPDCDLFGLKQIAGTIYPNAASWTTATRQLRDCLGLTPGATPTSYYHLHQLGLGENGAEPTLYLTHSNSEAAGSSSYDANAIAARVANQWWLKQRAGCGSLQT